MCFGAKNKIDINEPYYVNIYHFFTFIEAVSEFRVSIELDYF